MRNVPIHIWLASHPPIQVQAAILGDLQTQGGGWDFHNVHSSRHRRRRLLDSISGIQGNIRRYCIDYLHCRDCESSLHSVRTLDPTQSFVSTGHGCDHRDRRPHLEPHRQTQTRYGVRPVRAGGGSIGRCDQWFQGFDLPREV